MISLTLTEREAIVVHMIYALGSKIVAADPAKEIGDLAYNIHTLLSREYSPEEKAKIAEKITEMGAKIPGHVLQKIGVVRLDRKP